MRAVTVPFMAVAVAVAVLVSGCGGALFVEEPALAGDGAEPVQARSAGAAIPAGCTTWFDGCNTCEVIDGVLGACTRKACKSDRAAPSCYRFATDSETAAEEEAPDSVPEQQREASGDVPANCVIWFDGCNDCVVRGGKLVGCTSKQCTTLAEPLCRKSH